MRTKFTTGDLHKITGRKMCTLKDDIKSGLIMPYHKATGQNDKALFDIHGVYNAFLAFQAMRYRPIYGNLKKNRESTINELAEININWADVGPGREQIKYLVIHEKFVELPLVKAGGWEISRTYPKEQMADKELMRVVYNLAALKARVNNWIASNPEDPA